MMVPGHASLGSPRGMDVEEEASAYDMEPVCSHDDACISSLPLSTPSILWAARE